MCICCEIFPACIDRYWEFPEHPCVVNACCYACCGNGLEDPNLAQRIFCQCNTVANYDECGSEPHLISLALCPFLIPGAVYAAFFWEPHYDAERDKALRAFLKHREELHGGAREDARRGHSAQEVVEPADEAIIIFGGLGAAAELAEFLEQLLAFLAALGAAHPLHILLRRQAELLTQRAAL